MRGRRKKIMIFPQKKELAPTVHPTLSDIIFLAGFYEGEGYCGFTLNTNGLSGGIRIGIEQKDPYFLYRMRNLFGGSIGKHKNRDSQMYIWRVFGARARGLLMTIYKFLSPRRQGQIRKALNGWNDLIQSLSNKEVQLALL